MVIRREDLVRAQRAQAPGAWRRATTAPVRAGTTGSGESLLVLTWSAADLTRERAAGARLLGRLGIRTGMRVANTLAGALITPGSLLLGDVIEDLGALDIPLGAIESEAAARQAWELVDRVQPDVLVLEPASAPRFFAAAPTAARPWWGGIVWLRRGGVAVAVPVVPDTVGFTGWQSTWLAVPEVACFVASSCSAQRFHVDDGVGAEVLDDTLVLTRLEGDPPLRFATGIAARTLVPVCACGTPGPGLELA